MSRKRVKIVQITIRTNIYVQLPVVQLAKDYQLLQECFLLNIHASVSLV